MEEIVFSNPAPTATLQLDHEPWRLAAPVPSDVLDNDALLVRTDGGNVKDVLLQDVLNDTHLSLAPSDTDVKEGEFDVPASVWAALPQWLADQDAATGAPAGFWIKDGH